MSGERDRVNKLAIEFRSLCEQERTLKNLKSQVKREKELNTQIDSTRQEVYTTFTDAYYAVQEDLRKVQEQYKSLITTRDDVVTKIGTEYELLAAITSYLEQYE